MAIGQYTACCFVNYSCLKAGKSNGLFNEVCFYSYIVIGIATTRATMYMWLVHTHTIAIV